MSLTDTLIALARSTWGRFMDGGGTPAALLATMDDAIALSESVSREISQRAIPDLDKIACAKGCAWCCHYQIGVTAPQALHIAAKIANNAADLPAEILIPRLRALDATTRGLSRKERLKAKLLCAFVENGACSIYPFRPFSCRGGNSIDADLCRAVVEGRSDADASEQAWLHKVPYEAQRDVQNGIMAGARDLGLRDDRLELTAAVLTAVETPDAAARWIAGEDVFKDARLAN